MKKGIIFLSVFLLASVASAQTFELGANVLVNDDDAIDVSDVRGFVTMSGLDLPLPGDTVTGVTIEAGWSDSLIWSVWSMNRTEIAHVIAGVDVRIARGGPELGSDFDIAMRVVGGYRVTENLRVYAYLLEDNTPFSFAVGWQF